MSVDLYLSVADLQFALPVKVVADLTADSGTSVDVPTAEAAIENVSRLIDSYLQAGGVPVPLTAGKDLSCVKPHAINLLRVWLITRRLIDSDESKAWEMQKQTIDYLTKISTKEIKFGGGVVVTDDTAVNGSGWYSFTPEFNGPRSV